MRKTKVLSLIVALAMILGTMGTVVFAEETTAVATVGDVECADASAMISALNNASGDVTVGIYGKVKTSGFGFNNSKITKLSFVAESEDAEICVDGVSYIDVRYTNYPIEYTGLTLSHINAGQNIDGFLPQYFSTYNGGNVTYRNCTFPNGVTACGSVAGTTYKFIDCTFNNTTSGLYSLWIYGNSTNVVVDGGTFSGVRGIKLYSEDSNDFSSLSVSGATFSDTITEKHAVVLTKGESVTLTNNTFNNTKGIVEVDNDYASSIDGKTVTIDGTEYIVDSNNLALEEVTPLAPSGSINGGLVNIKDANRAFLSIESYITYANESVVVKVYDANDVLLATSTLIDTDRVILGKENWGGLSTFVGINCTDDWWNTVWENGKLRADYVPAKATLFVDGVEMNTHDIQMRAAGTELPVTWAEVPGVAPAGPVEVSTYEKLIEALAKDNANVIMMNDITATATQSNGYGKTGIVVDAGDILDGNGKTLTINGANSTWDSVIGMKGGEVKNLTIAGAMRGVFMPGANGDVVIDNCVFKDVVYTFNSDAGSKDYTVTIKNSALNGWTSFSNVHKSVTFENCTFGEGSGYKFCRPYQATEFNGCNFDTGYKFDASKTAANSLVFNDCTYAGAPLSASNGWQMFSAGNDVIIDGEKVHFINSDAVVACIGNTAYDNLQDALNAAVMAGEDVTVEILTDIDLEGVNWIPVSVNGAAKPAAHQVTVDGNNHKITHLNDMLFSGTWAGQSGLIINDLTIADSNIVNDKDDTAGTVGVGAFIGYPQASETITLNNCHLINSTVEGGHWTGGLIGMAGGYNGNDGPVFMNLTIIDCSVKDSVIKGKGSAGGLMGHASCAAWTKVTVENTVVSGNTVTSTGSSNNKAGAVFGTVGAAGTAATAAGETKTGGQFVAATVKNNTVTSNDTTITTIYGRQGTPTGKLELTGGSYDHKPISGEEAWAGVKEGFTLKSNSDGTYSVKEDTQWTTDIDAGYYMSASKKLGLMRYLFHFGGVGTIDKAGIKFIRGDKISEDMDNFVGTVEGNAKTFYGDINKIPENTEGKYYAVGFVTIGEKTYWSNPIFCEPNFTRYFSKYTGGAE